MSLGRGGMFGDPRTEQEKEMERRLLGGLLQPDTQQAVDGYAQMGGLLGQPEEKPKGYFNGGDFRTRDGLSLLLASVADGMARNSGYDATAGDTLFAGRLDAVKLARKKAEEQAQLAQRMAIAQRAFPNLSGGAAEAIGTGIANPSDFAGPAPTGTSRLMEESKNWTQEDWDAFGRLNPVQGADGRYYPRSMTPQTPLDPNEWERVDGPGGGTGNGVGGFRYRR